MKIYDYNSLTGQEVDSILRRPAGDFGHLSSWMTSILSEIRGRGDEALKDYTEKFDGVRLEDLRISTSELNEATARISPATRRAINDAADAIRGFHSRQMPAPLEYTTTSGATCGLQWRPVERVGLYIPGGSAPLVSTVLMLGVPARVAGCSEVILCSPPRRDSSLSAEILYAAQSLGITSIFKVGGAQAIAAMACGTSSIPSVDKIFGPGNRYVAAMKSFVSQPPLNVAIDMVAGPTELLVIADDSANPVWVAADLLSQAEHGADSQVLLVTASKAMAQEVNSEIDLQMQKLPRRDLVGQCLSNSSILLVLDLKQAVEVSNRYAPEHLILAVEGAESLAPAITNAGSVFLGHFSSVVFGDYASGTNHTLPTSGSAKSMGGLTVQSFMKPIYFQTIVQENLSKIVGTTVSLARAEGLEAHALAAEARMVTR